MSDLALLLLVVLVALLLVRGPGILPRLGAALGRGVHEARSHARGRFGAEPDAGVTLVSDGEPDTERRR